jgi:hypothetical protein
MRKCLCLVFCLIMLCGCESPDEHVLNKLIGHCNALLTIIRENQSDFDVVKEKIAAYRSKYGPEYAGLIQKLHTVSEENLKNPDYAEKLQEFTKKNYELIKEASKIGIDASF